MSALPFRKQTSSESSFDVEHITLTLKAGVCQVGKAGNLTVGVVWDSKQYVYTNGWHVMRAPNTPATIRAL